MNLHLQVTDVTSEAEILISGKSVENFHRSQDLFKSILSTQKNEDFVPLEEFLAQRPPAARCDVSADVLWRLQEHQLLREE